MKSVVRRLFINFEKEEKWLNDMSVLGYNFIDYSIARYLFEEGAPGEYIYRIELLDHLPSHPQSKAYIKFMEETGVECVSTFLSWVYFRKKACDGPFDLYSDYDSRIKHYKKVSSLVGILGLFNLVIAIINLALGLVTGNENGNYYNAYISLVNWTVVILLTPLLISYLRKIRTMKKEKQLYE